MQSYELQVYKGGKWEFDSYFDDRSTAVSEAERLHSSGRYSGIRVLEESYRDDSETSVCSVIFSRLKRINKGDDWRTRGPDAPGGATRETTSAGQSRNAGGGSEAHGAGARGRTRPQTTAGRRPRSGRNETSLYGLLGLTLLILLVGIAALIGLREMANSL